jgi:nucleotide-binding universal stress UspA family protein
LYRRILVPLDGSELAERALRHAQTIIGENPMVSLVLLRVSEPRMTASYYLIGDAEDWMRVEEQSKKDAIQYLSEVADRMKSAGVTKVRKIVLTGQTDDQILNYLKHHRFDLVIMSIHSESEISYGLTASVAERVMSHSSIPVFIIRSPGLRRRKASSSNAPLVHIATAPNEAIAGMWAVILESNAIPCVLKSDNLRAAQYSLPQNQFQAIYVLEPAAEMAKRLLMPLDEAVCAHPSRYRPPWVSCIPLVVLWVFLCLIIAY